MRCELIKKKKLTNVFALLQRNLLYGQRGGRPNKGIASMLLIFRIETFHGDQFWLNSVILSFI